jgi:hypothetical protein
MRKAMFTRDAFCEKLDAILAEFPILDVRAAAAPAPALPRLTPHLYRTCTRSSRR